MADDGIFDRQQLLRHTCNDNELAEQVCSIFLQDAPLQLDALEKAISSGDAEAAKRNAHSLKGSAATVGGEAMRSAALECEQLARAGDLASLPEKAGALGDAFRTLRSELLQHGYGKAP